MSARSGDSTPSSAIGSFDIEAQPDDTTCGPSCLHSVYRAWQHDSNLEDLIAEVPSLPDGGTLGVNLATHALRQGFSATIYTANLHVFDPTWFARDAHGHLANEHVIRDGLLEQEAAKANTKLSAATDAYLEFLSLGGQLRFENITLELLHSHFERGVPVLAGLSATYLYRCSRELDDDYDAVRGHPSGHFVVLHGADLEQRRVRIADPLADNPRFDSHYYEVGFDALLASIMLGIVTYDANIIVIEPA